MDNISSKNAVPALSAMCERLNKSLYPFYSNRFISTSEVTDKKAHFHDYAQVWYLVSGVCRHQVGEKIYDCTPGTIIIIPPGTSHDYFIDPGVSCDFIMFDAMLNFFDLNAENQINAVTHIFLSEFSRELNFEPIHYIVFSGEEKKAAESVFFKLCSTTWNREVNRIEQLKNDFCNVFSAGAFALSEKNIASAKKFLRQKYVPIIKTIYYMNINYNKIIHRDELIAMSHICQTDYFRLIKRIIGCTYSTYMQRLRVRRAVHMCSFAPYSLSYIADICGFGDLAYMEKRIKKFYPNGQKPREMKKRRSNYIKTWPFSIQSRTEYEDICPHFYAYGL